MYKDFSSITEVATDLKAIKQSIRNILLTRRGSVPGKPNFGSDLYNIIFSELDHLTMSIAKNYVSEALREFETRIDVKQVQVKQDIAFNKIIIDIYFTYTDISFNADVEEQRESVSVSFNL